jgi:YidC/Oxa1 family membrane protein insertase
MERRALLAIVLSVLILVLYQELVLKRYFPPPSETVPEAPATPESGAKAPLAVPPAGSPAKEAPASAAKPELAAGIGSEVVSVQGRDVVVETDLYEAVLNTAGARLKSFRLKRYRTTVDPNSPSLDLISATEEGGFPFGVILRGPQREATDGTVVYAVDRDGLRLEGAAKGSITFSGELDGARITKRFEMSGNSYFVELGAQVERLPPGYTEMAVGWPKHISQLHEKNKEVVFDSVLVLEANKLQNEKFGSLQSGKVLDKDIGWFAYSGRYFLAAMVPNGCTPGAKSIEGLRVWLQESDGTVEATALMPPGCLAPGFELYLGPKQLDRLTGYSLRRAVDLGWFSFIALPMLHVLQISHSITGNYGVDIILLTILIKIIFFPLTQKSFKSMKEMQKLQPQMTAIRERLKDKPDEMNKEIMELYRRNKVNPLGGCLPMVLQMPVFIGLYQALLNSVELRHAPFVGWINDLSAPDRLGSIHIPFVEPPGIPVLTLLMGVSMLIQQWMTPATTADPTQQRMMMFMPVVFTFMFISFPSGLTLYWLVNNILTIAQQVVINRTAATQ